MKGKALRRALSADALRVGADIPLIIDTTELITPTVASEMLKRNTCNRPINWGRVEEYAELMRSGQWRLHGQGVMLDVHGTILTGQKRLWAVVKSGVNVYMRISRGNPADTAHVIDRGTPQTSRDLASRQTGRKHSPTEASLCRAIAVLDGLVRPSSDELAALLSAHRDALAQALTLSKGGVKNRATLMVLAVLIHQGRNLATYVPLLPVLADQLEAALVPRTARECWGRGAAFSLAMEQAKRLVQTKG